VFIHLSFSCETIIISPNEVYQCWIQTSGKHSSLRLTFVAVLDLHVFLQTILPFASKRAQFTQKRETSAKSWQLSLIHSVNAAQVKPEPTFERRSVVTQSASKFALYSTFFFQMMSQIVLVFVSAVTFRALEGVCRLFLQTWEKLNCLIKLI